MTNKELKALHKEFRDKERKQKGYMVNIINKGLTPNEVLMNNRYVRRTSYKINFQK